MSTMIHAMAIDVERRIRSEHTDRDRLLNEAISLHADGRGHLLVEIRHRFGGALIAVGTRLDAAPRSESTVVTRTAC
jgi:hypothetical protein